MTTRVAGFGLNHRYARVSFRASPRLEIVRHRSGRRALTLDLALANFRVYNHSVAIGPSRQIGVVEHLFSALFGLDIHRLRIDVEGPEIPFFDGSSAPFLDPLASFPDDAEPPVVLKRPLAVFEGGSYISYVPWNRDRLQIDISLAHPYIKTQRIALIVDKKNYAAEIAPARTFVFTHCSDPRLAALPPYGFGITRRGVFSAAPLRFTDEPVRHKALDLLGDLYLIQHRISGRITARNPSHRLNLRFAKKFQALLHRTCDR